jgi:hypothetical protein
MKRLATILVAAWVGLLAAFSDAKAQTQATATAVESSHTFCTTTPCQFFGGSVNTTTTAVWLFLFDANAVPTGGGAAISGCLNAAAARPCWLKAYQVPAGITYGLANFFSSQGNFLLPVKSGFIAACSTTGPYTFTLSSTCTFSFEVQSP